MVLVFWCLSNVATRLSPSNHELAGNTHRSSILTREGGGGAPCSLRETSPVSSLQPTPVPQRFPLSPRLGTSAWKEDGFNRKGPTGSPSKENRTMTEK